MNQMQKWIDVSLKLFWSTFLVLTSFYALLASLPYTYYALIKSPAYAWMPWFANHHALLYWVALLCAALACRRFLKTAAFRIAFGLLGLVGVSLLVKPLLPTLRADATSYWVGVAALWPIALIAFLGIWKESASAPNSNRAIGHLSYWTAAFLAAGIALLYTAATRLQGYTATHTVSFTVKDIYLTAWSVISHLVVFLVLITLLNLVRMAATKTSRPRSWRWALTSLLLFAFLWILTARFLEGALSFEGWQVQLYAASLGAALVLLGLSIAAPFLLARKTDSSDYQLKDTFPAIAVLIAFILALFALHTFIGGADWNGFLQGTYALVFWIVLAVCLYRLRRTNSFYKLPTALLILVLALVAYKGLQAGEILWARPLGQTDDDIQRSFDQYAGRDVSFNLTHHLLGNGRSEPCGEACRIMRAYTNVSNVKVTFDLKLVDTLAPTSADRPNIFFIVVDSMRPDYLGAYNSKVDFTPNLDAFAKENIAMQGVYSPYAGTSLSEPAIWAGALLLHSHYMQPFSRLNSLEKLLRTDGYQMFISEDEVLSELIPPAKEVIRLDTNKRLWNQLELGSTLVEFEGLLQVRPRGAAPVFFYTQPKNVHQFATNQLPSPGNSGWQARPGFNYRISFEVHQVDQELGDFLSWLKTHGLYDDSIIIITSDHGDATGEFGRTSHSLLLYPEILRVPLLIHLPPSLRRSLVYDDSRVASLTDITPSLYYLLGHRPVLAQPLFGHPLFASTLDELHSYRRDDLFLASDVRAAYGILADNGRYFYATYDSPPQSYLFDLSGDPNGEHNILTSAQKQLYDQRVIDHLHALGDFYGYKPGFTSLAAVPNTQ
jgi:hypothetical protein